MPGRPPPTISKHEYTNNAVGLQINMAYSGSVFSNPDPPIGQSFGWNGRGELTN